VGIAVFVDSFDHYDTTWLRSGNCKWDIFTNPTNLSIDSSGVARTGAQCLKCASGSGGSWAGMYFPSQAINNLNALSVGFGFRPGTVDNHNFCRLTNSVTSPMSDATMNVGLSSGKVCVWSGNGTLLVSGVTRLIPGNWYYVEVAVYIHYMGGNATTLYLDGANEATSTAPNDMSGSFVDGVSLGSSIGNSSAPHYFDDLVVCDLSSSTSVVGPAIVANLLPKGAGTGSWTQVGSGVGEIVPDSDAGYIKSTAVNQQQNFSCYPLPRLSNFSLAASSVSALQVNTVSRLLGPPGTDQLMARLNSSTRIVYPLDTYTCSTSLFDTLAPSSVDTMTIGVST